MNLENGTQMQSGYVLGLDVDGRELLIMVVKGTFIVPEAGEEAQLAPEQAPLVYAEEFTGEPGFSATLYESDFAAFKPRCDVLLNGSAYAPGGNPVRQIPVELRAGPMTKRFNVVGDRIWKKGFVRAHPSRPKPFTVMPISYDNAFGGVDNLDKDPRKHVTHLSNFAGKGFYPRSGRFAIAGKPVPNTEECGKRVRRPGRRYHPMAFGAIGRAWQPRCQHAGTFDQRWIDKAFPFLPKDFNPLYNQSAPPDQQIDYLKGGEEISLVNLMPRSPVSFRLPVIEVPILVRRKDRSMVEIDMINDTLIIEPDLNRFIRVWRAVLPLRKNIFEIESAITGRKSSAWYRARQSRKAYFASIQDFMLSREERETEREPLEEEDADTEETPEFEEAETAPMEEPIT